MKIETRKVYVANDNTEWPTEASCLEHEQEDEIVCFLHDSKLYERDTSFEEVVVELMKQYTFKRKNV